MFATTNAQQPQDNNATDTPEDHNTQQLMDERVSELMADRVGFKKDLALMELAAMNERAEREAYENLLYPADDLYGGEWENSFVNPFRGKKIEYPDSCVIDCSTFVLPIDTMTYVTSKYGPRRGRMHRGIDLKVWKGDTIRAAFDGRIRIRAYERRGYGYYLVIRHPNGLETVYGHLSKFLVKVNDIVHAGEPIGLGGNTGRSTGSHLHFETRFLGQSLDPADLIDFNVGAPYQDEYVFRNIKINGRNSNIYTASNGEQIYHQVKSGDTLGKIARMYGTTVNQLCVLNGIKSTSILRIGQRLCVAAGAETTPASSKATTPTKTAEKKQAVKTTTTTKTTTTATQSTTPATKQVVVKATASANTQGAAAGAVYHRIQAGDTLYSLARKYGTTVDKLCELNGITQTTILRLGQSLRCS